MANRYYITETWVPQTEPKGTPPPAKCRFKVLPTLHIDPRILRCYRCPTCGAAYWPELRSTQSPHQREQSRNDHIKWHI
jgi:hypothetical protein